jgi:hypothetical protein
MTWTPVSNPHTGELWGITDRGRRTVWPVCRLAGCNQIPANPNANDETGDYCTTHLAQIQARRNIIVAHAVIHDGRPGSRAVHLRLTGECGTDAGYKRHLSNKTTPCEPCRTAHAADAYDRRHGVRHPVPLLPCGTLAAFQRHRIKGEEPCDECRQAQRTRDRENYQRRKARRLEAVRKGWNQDAERSQPSENGSVREGCRH